MTRRIALAVLAAVLAAAALAGVWRAATAPGPQSLDARTQAVAATLRCPTCQNLAVADSPSPMARGMRDIIAEQLQAGRTPAEIQAWFVDRYGPWILLYPPRAGVSWVAWLAPALAFLGIGGLAYRRLGRRQRMLLDDADRARAEDAYRRRQRGDLVLGDDPADERLAVALHLLESVRTGDDDLAPAGGAEAERIALRQVAAAVDAREAEQPRIDVNSPDEPSAEAPRPAPAPRRAAGWAATVAVFVVAVAVLLPPAIGPRAVGGVPTGSVPGRAEPDILGGDESRLAGEQQAELERLADAVQADPGDVETRLRLADALLAADRVDEAAVHYRQVVSARPDDPVTRLTLAVALLQLGDAAGAERHAVQVLDQRPDHPEALLLAGLARVAQADAQGRANLRQFLAVAPADHPGRAMAEAVLGEPPAAATAAPQELRIGLVEYEVITSQAAVIAGDVVLSVTNAGAQAHDLRVEGAVEPAATPRIPPGGVATLRLRVPVGQDELVLWCTLPGHRAQGMQARLAVSSHQEGEAVP